MNRTYPVRCLGRAPVWLHTPELSCSPITISAVCFWMKFLASEGKKGQGEVGGGQKWLRPMLAENWVSPLLLPKVKSRK